MSSADTFLKSPPHAFLRTVGLSTVEADAVLEVSSRQDPVVRWRLAPPGLLPDVYVAHLRSVHLPEDSGWHVYRGPANRFRQEIVIDDDGLCHGRPVCLLGEDDTTHEAWAPDAPEAIAELKAGLGHAVRRLLPQRLDYELARVALRHRRRWGTHAIRLTRGEDGELLALISPSAGVALTRQGLQPEELGSAMVRTVPAAHRESTTGFDVRPMERMLWIFALRCADAALADLVPAIYLTAPLTRRKPVPVENGLVSDHCRAFLGLLEKDAATAGTLGVALGLERTDLLRALACLTLSRSIGVDHDGPRVGRLQVLSTRLRRLFGR